MELNKKDFIYEGKAKKLYATDDPDVVIVEYRQLHGFQRREEGDNERQGTAQQQDQLKAVRIP